MKNNFFKYLLATIVIVSCSRNNNNENLTKYVNPFIGTSGTGHTFPGATLPFGFIQLSPETNNVGWDYCSAYHYTDSTIIGFAHTHMSGTGWMDLGDVLIFPFSQNKNRDKYSTKIDKKSEIAMPGFYSVELPSESIKAELTATERSGVHRYTFNKGGASYFLIDLQSGIVGDSNSLKKHVLNSIVNIESNTCITGSVESKHWVQQKMFFVVEFSKPFSKSDFIDGEVKRKLCLEYNTSAGEVIELRVAVSSVDIEGAKKNLLESKNKSFDIVKNEANEKWNQTLSKIKIDGTEEQKIGFYTSMYHLFIQPNNMADADGRYRGANDSVAQSSTQSYFSTFSIWDTYRAAHPLYTIITPEKDGEMVLSMLNHFDAVGMLPIWTVWGKDNFCMIGNHAVPIIVDAYFKGILSKNESERAFAAINRSLTHNSWHKYNWVLYDKYGYLPSDSVTYESVSRTLEATTDDWCAAQMANSLGKTKEYDFFNKRANYYKNLYDSSTKFMRGKTSKGNWVSPFNPLEFSPGGGTFGEYTEGNAWQYLWHVQHDIKGLINLMGGDKVFEQRLDTLFTMRSDVYGKGNVHDISGLIGQYVHGNEPSHHVAYLYNYTGAAWKTQKLIPEIILSQYKNKPDGLCGNDDCGQMSAWYIFSSLGFYPVNPASGIYVIGAPQVKEAVINLQDGKTFKVVAKNISKNNIYIQSAKLNGKPLETSYITHAEIMNGGLLEFEMGDKPNKELWASASAYPHSMTK